MMSEKPISGRHHGYDEASIDYDSIGEMRKGLRYKPRRPRTSETR